MHLIGISLAIVLAMVGFWVIAKHATDGRISLPSMGSKLPCAKCEHCRRLFEDGSICSFNGRETFKNLTHVGNCIDWQRKSAGRRNAS